MKFSVSNIALPAFDHVDTFSTLAELGIGGIEVAPSRIWHETWGGLTAEHVAAYRREIERAGLQVVGLHSLLYDHPGLGLFGDPKTRADTLEFLVHLSGVCRDLGGRTLIFGGGRNREGTPMEMARTIASEFLADYVSRTAEHGTCLCFEPLGPSDSDFVNSAYDALDFVEAINHHAFRVQLDAKALVENKELSPAVFDDCEPYLVHFHANDPGLEVLGATGKVDHAWLGTELRRIEYDQFVSIEQRMLNPDDPLSDIVNSVGVLKSAYAGVSQSASRGAL